MRTLVILLLLTGTAQAFPTRPFGGSLGNFRLSSNTIDLTSAGTMTIGGTATIVGVAALLRVSDGTEAAPSVSFTAGTGYGMWKNAGFLAFSRDGTQVIATDGSTFYHRGNLQNLANTPVQVSSNGFAPSSDSDQPLGVASKRWSYVVVGDADADKPTCDATTRGAMFTMFAANGASDILKVCMKQAAGDSYAWRSAFTAP